MFNLETSTETVVKRVAELKGFIARSLLEGINSEAEFGKQASLREAYQVNLTALDIKLPAGWDSALVTDPSEQPRATSKPTAKAKRK
jgi:hypothetical protein